MAGARRLVNQRQDPSAAATLALYDKTRSGRPVQIGP